MRESEVNMGGNEGRGDEGKQCNYTLILSIGGSI